MVCVYIHYRSVSGCVLYYCLQYYIHTGYITRCVCSTIICSIIYIQTKLLQCYYREIVQVIYSHVYVMFRALELMTLDLLCLYSNTVP